MRSEQAMMDLIMKVAQEDNRIEAVLLNGSRANPKIKKDEYQDYDIIYIVKELNPFLSDSHWIDCFGERYILQMPEAMRDPSNKGHFNWMMLFNDGNRLDLTLIPMDKLDLALHDSLTIVLLDKHHCLPNFAPSSDESYHIESPSPLFYHSCCNNFWWCMQNVGKGIKRGEIPYSLTMFHTVVQPELYQMIDWYIGAQHDFHITAGKMGKHYQQLLPNELYTKLLDTYSDCDADSLWKAIFASCDLFSIVAKQVGIALDYSYHEDEEANMRKYLKEIK